MPSSADVVTFESRLGNNTSFGSGADYVTNWAGLSTPAGYGSSGISVWDTPTPGGINNHDLIPGGTSNNLAFLYHVDFTVDADEIGIWDIRIAPDFGFGGVVYLDGVEMAYNPTDMWWGLDWNNTSEIFTFSQVFGSTGNHTIDMYGQEFCCDGDTAGQYRIRSIREESGVNSAPRNTWIPFTTTTPVVPEPGSIAMGLAGLSGLGFLALRRRK